jgi:hypothetical protein
MANGAGTGAALAVALGTYQLGLVLNRMIR